MFKLSNKEFTDLRSQFVTSSWGGTRYAPMAFTEAGIAMLSSVLKSKRAIEVNIKIIRIFIKLRKLLTVNEEILGKLGELQLKEAEHDQQIHLIFEYLDQLEQPRQEEEDFRDRKQIGFRQTE